LVVEANIARTNNFCMLAGGTDEENLKRRLMMRIEASE
jgi:hypothetical protein